MKTLIEKEDGFDVITDEDRSKRAIAILLDVSESLDEEIRASTPKRDEPISSVSTSSRIEEDKEEALTAEEYRTGSSKKSPIISSTGDDITIVSEFEKAKAATVIVDEVSITCEELSTIHNLTPVNEEMASVDEHTIDLNIIPDNLSRSEDKLGDSKSCSDIATDLKVNSESMDAKDDNTNLHIKHSSEEKKVDARSVKKITSTILRGKNDNTDLKIQDLSEKGKGDNLTSKIILNATDLNIIPDVVSKNKEELVNIEFQNTAFKNLKAKPVDDSTYLKVQELSEENTADSCELQSRIAKMETVPIENKEDSDLSDGSNDIKKIIDLNLSDSSNEDSTVFEGFSKENTLQVNDLSRKPTKSFTEVLGEDIFKEIEQILELNLSETDDENEKEGEPKIVFDKKLVVLIPKMNIDAAVLEAKDVKTPKFDKIEELKERGSKEVLKVEEDNKDDHTNASTSKIKNQLEITTKTKEILDVDDKFLNVDKEKNVNIQVVQIGDDNQSKQFISENSQVNMTKNFNIRRNTSRCYCEVCSLLFSDPRAYWNHRYLNHDNHEFGCSLCERKFKKVSSLIHHTKFRHGDTLKLPTIALDKKDVIFFCESCGEGFSNVQSRLLHIQNSHVDKYILCNCCHLSFSNIDDLVFHAKRHQVYKDTNYTCRICNRTIFFLSNFLVHIKKHNLNIEPKFSCKICKFKTKNFKLYKSHMVTHKKFHCIKCTQKFISRKKLILHKTKNHKLNCTRKHFVDRSYAFSNHVKGRRLYTLKLRKNINGDQVYTFFKVIAKHLPDPSKIVIIKATRLSKRRACRDKFNALMKKLAVSNIAEFKKILYIKLTRYNDIKLKHKKRTRRSVPHKNEAQISSTSLADETDFKKLDIDAKSLEKPSLESTISQKAVTSRSPESTEFKKPMPPAQKSIKKKIPSPCSKPEKKSTTSNAETKKDEESVKFEPGKTAIDAQGLQKSTELSSYKIPKRDKPRPASKKALTSHKKDQYESKTSIITGDAKHLKEAKEAGIFNLEKSTKVNISSTASTDKTRKSRFEPIEAQKKKEENTKMATVTKSSSNPAQVPTIVDKTIDNRGEKKLYSSSKNISPQRRPEPLMKRHVPVWNAPCGPGPFDNNAPFPVSTNVGHNQSQQFIEQFGNNMAWETAAQNLMAQSFGASHSNINVQNPGFTPHSQGMSPFGGQGFSPFQGSPQQGPLPFGPQFGPFGPVNFPSSGLPMMGPPQNFNVTPYFESFQSDHADMQESPNHVCSGCEKEFPSPKVLELHSIFCNKLPALADSQLVCPVCSQTFEKRTVLKQHMFILHSKLFSKFNLILGIEVGEKHKCKVCPQVFESKKDKEAHEQTHVFLDAFNAVKARQDKNVTISAPPVLNRPSTSGGRSSVVMTKNIPKTASSAMTKEQLAESAKKALQQIQSPAFKKKLEQQKKQLQINLQYLKSKKAKQGSTVTSAPETKLKITPQPVPAPSQIPLSKSSADIQWEPFLAVRKTKILESKRSPVSGHKLSDSRIRRRSHSRSRSLSPKGKGSRKKSRSVSPKGKGGRRRSRSKSPRNRRRSRSKSPRNRRRTRSKSPRDHRRSRSESPKDKGISSQRSRSRDRVRVRRRSRSTSLEKLSRSSERSRSPKRRHNTSKEKSGSKERSQSPLRSRPKPKLNPENAAYRCSKCAMLFSNFRDYANHKESHEGSDDEESYLSLMDCPPPPPVSYGGYKKSSASTSMAAYSCVVCLQTFRNQQLKDEHFCSGPF